MCLHVCVSICRYVRICMCMCTCMCWYVIFACACAYTSACVCTPSVWVCVHAYAYVYVIFAYANVSICIYICIIYVWVTVHVHVHVQCNMCIHMYNICIRICVYPSVWVCMCNRVYEMLAPCLSYSVLNSFMIPRIFRFLLLPPPPLSSVENTVPCSRPWLH